MTSDELSRRRKGVQITSFSESIDDAIEKHADLYIAEMIGVMFICAVGLIFGTTDEDEE